MKYCLLISLFFFLSSSFAAYGPGGSFEDVAADSPVEGGKWAPSWSKAFLSVWNGTWGGPNAHRGYVSDLQQEREKGLSSIMEATKNGQEFCSDPVNTPAGAALFALSMAKSICVPESACRPRAVNPNGATARAIGLFQIGVQDAKNHDCVTGDGREISSEEQLKDGANNAACMAKIMMGCATGLDGRANYHVGQIAGGPKRNRGFVGCFWQPVRGNRGTHAGHRFDNSGDRRKIAQFTNNFCEKAEGGARSVISAGLMTEEEVNLAMNNGQRSTPRLPSPRRRNSSPTVFL